MITAITVTIKNKEYQHFSIEACYSQFCAAAINPLFTPCPLSCTQADMKHSAVIIHRHTHVHTKSLTPICKVRLTLPDYGNSLFANAPADMQEERFYGYVCCFHESREALTITQKHITRMWIVKGVTVLPCWICSPFLSPFHMSDVWIKP